MGLLLLENPEILSLDLETPMVSVLRLLKHFGMLKKDLRDVGERYPHVLRRNRLANVPYVMRALDLNEWFFSKIRVQIICWLLAPPVATKKRWIKSLWML